MIISETLKRVEDFFDEESEITFSIVCLCNNKYVGKWIDSDENKCYMINIDYEEAIQLLTYFNNNK